MICTFLPLIYTAFPFLGTIRAVLLIGIAIVFSYFLSRDSYRNEGVFGHGLFKVWIWFLVLVAIGIVFSMDRGRSQVTLEVCLKYFVLFVIMIRIIDTSRRLDLVMRVFGLCAVGMGVAAVYNYVSGQLIGGTYRAMALEVGIFADPNDLNTLLNAALPFMMYSVMLRRRARATILGMAIAILAIMLSFSRGGFLGLLCVCVGYYFLFAKEGKRSGRRKKIIFYLSLSAILFFYLAPGAYKDRLTTIYNWEVDVGTGLTGTRLDAWRAVTLYGLARNPILGSGPGTSVYAAGEVMNDWHAMHNSFIQILVEMGVAGLVCYCFFYIIPFRQCRSLIRRRAGVSQEQVVRMKVITLSFIGFGVTASFLHQPFSPILFMLTGLFIIQSELIRKEESATAKEAKQ